MRRWNSLWRLLVFEELKNKKLSQLFFHHRFIKHIHINTILLQLQIHYNRFLYNKHIKLSIHQSEDFIIHTQLRLLLKWRLWEHQNHWFDHELVNMAKVLVLTELLMMIWMIELQDFRQLMQSQPKNQT